MIISVSGIKKEINSGTILQFLNELNINQNNVAVVKNGKIIQRNDWISEKIHENDNIDIFSPVSGG